MKLLKDINNKESLELLNRGMETAKPYGALCYLEAVIVLEGILESGIYESFDELEDAKDTIANLETEISELNKLIDKLIEENTELKTYIKEKHSKWK